MYLDDYELAVKQMGITFEGAWCPTLGQGVFCHGLVGSFCQSIFINDL